MWNTIKNVVMVILLCVLSFIGGVATVIGLILSMIGEAKSGEEHIN